VQVQRLVSVVKMTTVLKECIDEEQHSVVHFLWPKGLKPKDIYKEKFPVHRGSLCHVKLFTTGSRNPLKGVRKSQMMFNQVEPQVRKWLRLQCSGFRCTGEAIGQVYQFWWRMCQEINFFPGSNITNILHFIYICDSPLYVGQSNEKCKFVITIRNLMPLSCKLAILLLVV
jgi:hypothetical protein